MSLSSARNYGHIKLASLQSGHQHEATLFAPKLYTAMNLKKIACRLRTCSLCTKTHCIKMFVRSCRPPRSQAPIEGHNPRQTWMRAWKSPPSKGTSPSRVLLLNKKFYWKLLKHCFIRLVVGKNSCQNLIFSEQSWQSKSSNVDPGAWQENSREMHAPLVACPAPPVKINMFPPGGSKSDALDKLWFPFVYSNFRSLEYMYNNGKDSSSKSRNWYRNCCPTTTKLCFSNAIFWKFIKII